MSNIPAIPANQISVDSVIADDGSVISPGSAAQSYGYDGSGNMTTITVVINGRTYVQTWTYSGTNVASISQWVRQ